MTPEQYPAPEFRKGDLIQITAEGIVITVMMLSDATQEMDFSKYREVYKALYLESSIYPKTNFFQLFHWYPTSTHKDVKYTILGRLDD